MTDDPFLGRAFRFVLGASCLILLAGTVLCVLFLPACEQSQTTPAQAAAEKWDYHFIKDGALSAFDIRFRVTADPVGSMRLLFAEAQSHDGFFVELGPSGVTSGRTVNGDVYQRTPAPDTPTLQALDGKKVVFESRRHRWTLSAAGRLLAGGDEPPRVGTRIGFAVSGGEARVSDLRFQPVADVLFSDNFMRTVEDPTNWTELRGVWRINSLQNPLLSANAFSYVAVGNPEAAAVAGEWFWSDLAYSVACRPAAKGAVGIYFCYRGPDDYFLFQWKSSDSEAPSRRIVHVANGTETVLAESAGGYVPDQWYELGALVGAGWAQIRIGDTPVLTVRNPALSYGKIGLYAHGAGKTVFDDVHVDSHPATLVDFGRYRLGEWLASGGEWMQLAPAGWEDADWSGGMMVNEPTDARLLWGRPDWSDYRLHARLGGWRHGALGLCFRYQDTDNFYTACWVKDAESSSVQIRRTLHGKETLLAESAVESNGAAPEMAVLSEGARIVVMLDGRQVLSTLDAALLSGRVGLYADGADAATFTDVMCAFLPMRQPLPKHHRAFSAEQGSDMILWSGPLADWEKGIDARSDNEVVEVLWHRLDFHGDVRLDMRLLEPIAPGAEVGLAVAGSGGDFSQGYVARIRRAKDSEDESDPVPILELLAAGEVLGSQVLDWPGGPQVLGIERAGNVLAVHLGDRIVISCPFDNDTTGRRIGWFAHQADVEVDDVDIYSENVITYVFDTAPTDWREAGGLWKVSNKWQCDPRWSFFSGMSDDLASLWNQRPLYGDFTIEFYVGNKMLREKQQKSSYDYAQDMNITVCGDGGDLTSGYSFLLGGFGNTFTGAYREEERWAVPESNGHVLINRSGLHRKWYRVTIGRRGEEIFMRVAERRGSAVKVYDVVRRKDDNPLMGKHWALWTWDNGIMIGRVTVSAERIGPCQSPDGQWPKRSACIYAK